MSSKELLLKQIENQIINCKSCRLYKKRCKAVPGAGHPNSKVVFVGEAPGFNEDRKGLPFVGKSGKHLDKLLKELGVQRSQIWIGNIIKCRPPENRDPMVDEIRACKPYLKAQIRAINPRIIVTLGRFAMNHYLPNAKISQDHGIPKKIGERIIYPVYHPAAALRSDKVAEILHRDFLQIPRILEKPLDEIENVKNGKIEQDDGQESLF